jgi:GNAT superfamily N-acetyltransferase
VTGKLSIREADVEDATVVATLFTEFNGLLGADGLPHEQAFLPQHVQVTAAQMARRLERMATVERAFIAAVDEEPAGLTCLRLVPYVGQDAPYAELTQLYVRQRYQRQGVGAALIREVEQRAVQAGATCVHIIMGRDNKGAQAFYCSQGYTMPGVELEKHFVREATYA